MSSSTLKNGRVYITTNPKFKIKDFVMLPAAWVKLYNTSNIGEIVGTYTTTCYCYVVFVNGVNVPFLESELVPAGKSFK